ncbi:MAG: phage tail tube protein, partial [Xenococcaceae cyanobacterium]
SETSPVFLAFEDAVTGGERFVKVTAPAADGATSLTVAPLKRAIAPASTGQYPVKLQARTSADLSTSNNNVTSTTFDSGGYVDGVIASIGYGLSCPGNFLQLDAGFRTAFFAFNEFREVWITLKMPNPGAGYTSGYIFKGPASVTDCPISDPADGVISANVSLEMRGKLTVIEPQ